ncbi:MAG TPA: hypothetical protein PLZ40_05075, partial [Ferruginibacter sp.]|nr:hypothetical protein [Ferruginibacter sp.]
MRILIFLVFLLFSARLTFSQIEGKTIDFNNKLEISLEKVVCEKPLGDQFHSVQVIDARDDTVAVGFYSV